MQEFEDALVILMKQLNLDIKQKEIRDIAHSLDINKDGHIDFNEFLEAFRIVDSMGKEKPHRSSVMENISEDLIDDDKAMFEMKSNHDSEQYSCA